MRFRAWRRGFREADLILGPFADAHVSSMTALELDQFEALLEQSDHDIYGWFQGAIPVPADFDNALMVRLRRFDPSGVAPASRI